MVDRRVLLKLLEVHDLPTLPAIVSNILETVADETSSAGDLTELLERDHAISAHLLRLANSAFYGFPHRVDSVRQGVVVLGFNETRCLALATSVFSTVAKRQQIALDPEDFWMHSFGAAKAAQILSEKYCRESGRERCYTVGLLHDIGKYVLALVLKADYKDIVDRAKATGRALTEIESERLGMTHAQVGRWLADKWRLPAIVGNVIANLHHARVYSGADKKIVAAVAIADVLSAKARFGFAGESEDPNVDTELLQILDLPQEKFDSFVTELTSLREETRQFLHVLKGGA